MDYRRWGLHTRFKESWVFFLRAFGKCVHCFKDWQFALFFTIDRCWPTLDGTRCFLSHNPCLVMFPECELSNRNFLWHCCEKKNRSSSSIPTICINSVHLATICKEMNATEGRKFQPSCGSCCASPKSRKALSASTPMVWYLETYHSYCTKDSREREKARSYCTNNNTYFVINTVMEQKRILHYFFKKIIAFLINNDAEG